MSGAQSISTRRAYGVQRVCRVWHRARSSVYARRQATRSPSPARCRRRGPIGAAPDDVLVAHIRRVLEASPANGPCVCSSLRRPEPWGRICRLSTFLAPPGSGRCPSGSASSTTSDGHLADPGV